jgi:hypothetical protein
VVALNFAHIALPNLESAAILTVRSVNYQQRLGRAQVMIDSFSSLRTGTGKTAVCVSRLYKRVIAQKFAPMREDHPDEECQPCGPLEGWARTISMKSLSPMIR